MVSDAQCFSPVPVVGRSTWPSGSPHLRCQRSLLSVLQCSTGPLSGEGPFIVYNVGLGPSVQRAVVRCGVWRSVVWCTKSDVLYSVVWEQCAQRATWCALPSRESAQSCRTELVRHGALVRRALCPAGGVLCALVWPAGAVLVLCPSSCLSAGNDPHPVFLPRHFHFHRCRHPLIVFTTI